MKNEAVLSKINVGTRANTNDSTLTNGAFEKRSSKNETPTYYSQTTKTSSLNKRSTR